MSLYAVVQERFEKIDPERLLTVLREQGRLTRTDAARVARSEQGILWERFQFNEAQDVVGALASHDYAARVVPAESLPKLDKPRMVRWLEIGEDALRVPWTMHQETIPVPWPCVFVISAGEVGEVTEKFVTTGVRFDANQGMIPDREVERASRRVSVTDLIAIAEDGQYLHIRLPAKELVYDRILGPSERIQNSFQRYLAVLDELVARSSAAIVSPKTRRLLVDRKEKYEAERSAAWSSLDKMAFEKYNRWLLQLVVFSEQRKQKEEDP
ncbi:MAG: hypothetical protein IH991_04715 [Planctomycetes bacterium]|nr:hypothetical protein [Planctomycetota bacterium]